MPLKTVFGAARERLKHLAAMLKTSIALAHRLLLLLLLLLLRCCCCCSGGAPPSLTRAETGTPERCAPTLPTRNPR
jgi:hypothetical protein